MRAVSDQPVIESAGSSRETAIYRPAARVLLIDPSARVLLFRVDIRERPLWITPGGGLEAGESFKEAARRELFEETGVQCELGPCVWLRRHVFVFDPSWISDGDELPPVWIDEVERIFVARCGGGVEVTRANWLPHEHKFMSEHRWWTGEEIAGSSDWFAPRRMGELLPAVIAAEYSAEPIEVDE